MGLADPLNIDIPFLLEMVGKLAEVELHCVTVKRMLLMGQNRKPKGTMEVPVCYIGVRVFEQRSDDCELIGYTEHCTRLYSKQGACDCCSVWSTCCV